MTQKTCGTPLKPSLQPKRTAGSGCLDDDAQADCSLTNSCLETPALPVCTEFIILEGAADGHYYTGT